MNHLIPNGFLTIRQAVEQLAVAMYCGVPDTPAVKKQRASGVDVADGAAIEAANLKIWVAVDKGKLQVFVVGARRAKPLKLSASSSKEITGLPNPSGGDLSFLRHGNRHYYQFVERFGRNPAKASVVFAEAEIRQRN